MLQFSTRCTTYLLFATSLAASVSSLPAGHEHGSSADWHHRWHSIAPSTLVPGVQPNFEVHNNRYTHNLFGTNPQDGWLDQQHDAALSFPPHVASDGLLPQVSPQRIGHGAGISLEQPSWHTPHFSQQGHIPSASTSRGPASFESLRRYPSHVSPPQGKRHITSDSPSNPAFDRPGDTALLEPLLNRPSHVSPPQGQGHIPSDSPSNPAFDRPGDTALLEPLLRSPSHVSPQALGHSEGNLLEHPSGDLPFFSIHQGRDWQSIDGRPLSPVHSQHDSSPWSATAQGAAAAEFSSGKSMEAAHRGNLQMQHSVHPGVWLPLVETSYRDSPTVLSSSYNSQRSTFEHLWGGESLPPYWSDPPPASNDRVGQVPADSPGDSRVQGSIAPKRLQLGRPPESQEEQPPSDQKVYRRPATQIPEPLRQIEKTPPSMQPRKNSMKYYEAGTEVTQRMTGKINSQVFNGKLNWVPLYSLDKRLKGRNRRSVLTRSRVLPWIKFKEIYVGPHPSNTVKEVRFTNHKGSEDPEVVPPGHPLYGRTFFNFWGIPDNSQAASHRKILHFGTGYIKDEDLSEVEAFMRTLSGGH